MLVIKKKAENHKPKGILIPPPFNEDGINNLISFSLNKNGDKFEIRVTDEGSKVNGYSLCDKENLLNEVLISNLDKKTGKKILQKLALKYTKSYQIPTLVVRGLATYNLSRKNGSDSDLNCYYFTISLPQEGVSFSSNSQKNRYEVNMSLIFEDPNEKFTRYSPRNNNGFEFLLESFDKKESKDFMEKAEQFLINQIKFYANTYELTIFDLTKGN